jgi:hypothetical protein
VLAGRVRGEPADELVLGVAGLAGVADVFADFDRSEFLENALESWGGHGDVLLVETGQKRLPVFMMQQIVERLRVIAELSARDQNPRELDNRVASNTVAEMFGGEVSFLNLPLDSWPRGPS